MGGSLYDPPYKIYTINIFNILNISNYQNMSYAEIWRKATGANKPSHQGEIAVVLGLYEAGHII